MQNKFKLFDKSRNKYDYCKNDWRNQGSTKYDLKQAVIMQEINRDKLLQEKYKEETKIQNAAPLVFKPKEDSTNPFVIFANLMMLGQSVSSLMNKLSHSESGYIGNAASSSIDQTPLLNEIVGERSAMSTRSSDKPSLQQSTPTKLPEHKSENKIDEQDEVSRQFCNKNQNSKQNSEFVFEQVKENMKKPRDKSEQSIFEVFLLNLQEYWYGENPTMPSNKPHPHHQLLEEFFARTGAYIVHDKEYDEQLEGMGAIAYHNPNSDMIVVSDSDSRNSESYFHTLSHELIHWTRTPERCNRSFVEPRVERQVFEDSEKQNLEDIKSFEENRKKVAIEYAKEELVAEFGAVLLFNRLDNSSKVREYYANYLSHYLSKIPNNREEVLRDAFQKAKHAVDYLFQKACTPKTTFSDAIDSGLTLYKKPTEKIDHTNPVERKPELRTLSS